MATPKNTTLMFHGKNDLPLPSRNATIELVFDAACFEIRSLVRVVRKNITYVI